MSAKTPLPLSAVSSKFQAPIPGGRFITRDRLIDALRESRVKRLTLICAPAGYGKTTLAAQWQRILIGEGNPAAWLTLDVTDNDALSFLRHLIEAVRRVRPHVAADLVQALEQNSDEAQHYVLTELVNQIAESREPLVLILDDWHVIEDARTRAMLEFLLDVGPDNLRLVVTSRTHAPAITRLKVSNQVTEIDAGLLRFNQSESAAFLADVNTLPLTLDDVHRLWSSTDGWIAALQLATLSLRNTRDPSALINGFSGSHQSIADYFAENVLDNLEPDLLDFLTNTSICDRLCGDLAGAVSGEPRGQILLEELEHQNLFLEPLDDNREWFRYHRLFAGYLQRRLERDASKERIGALHRAASAWFAEHGMLNEALTHALAAGDGSGAVDLIEHQAMYLVEHSRMTTLLSLVNKLPKSLRSSRPELQIATAWANCLLQRTLPTQAAVDHLRATLSGVDDATSIGILGEADVIQATVDVYGDRIDRAAELVAPYITGNPKYRPWLIAGSANIQTFVDIHTFAYDVAQARQRWANTFHDRSDGPFLGVYGRCMAGLAASARLDLTAAERQYREAFSLAREDAGQYSHAARLAGGLLGALRYEHDDMGPAEQLLEECHELGAESGVADFLIPTYITLARIRTLRGDIDDAWVLLDEGARIAGELSLPRLAAAVDHERIRLHLALGDVVRAEGVLASRTDHPTGEDNGIAMAIRHYQYAMHARLERAHGDYAAAAERLSRMLEESSSAAWPYAEVSARIELAVTLSLSGNHDAAVRTLVPALVAGARAGLVRSIVDAGPELVKLVAPLCAAIRSQRWPAGLPSVPIDYLSKLLATARTDREKATLGATDRGGDRSPLPEEPLNAREINIVRLLDRGLSNKQIARNLGVTVNTVKWYLKNIYTKLGVTSRGASVSEARRRHILS